VIHPAQAELTDNDVQLAETAIALELSARDLYDSAISAGADDELWAVLREQHESYAQRLAGIIGNSAGISDAELFDSLSGPFGAADPAEPAAELENTLAATHIAALAEITDDEVAGAVASIVAMESRHATILTIRAGVTDPAALYVNPVSEASA